MRRNVRRLSEAWGCTWTQEKGSVSVLYLANPAGPSTVQAHPPKLSALIDGGGWGRANEPPVSGRPLGALCTQRTACPFRCLTCNVHMLVKKCKRQSLSCIWLCDPVDCSPPGSSVHGILQARILEWVAVPFSRGSSWTRGWTQVSCIAGEFFTVWATWEACLGTIVCTIMPLPARAPYICKEILNKRNRTETELAFSLVQSLGIC